MCMPDINTLYKRRIFPINADMHISLTGDDTVLIYAYERAAH